MKVVLIASLLFLFPLGETPLLKMDARNEERLQKLAEEKQLIRARTKKIPIPSLGTVLMVFGSLAFLIFLQGCLKKVFEKMAEEKMRKLPKLSAMHKISSLSLKKGGEKGFYQETSAILREYAESAFGVRAKEETTQEFLYKFKASKRFSSQDEKWMSEFLTRADLEKFSGATVECVDQHKDLDNLRSFIKTH